MPIHGSGHGKRPSDHEALPNLKQAQLPPRPRAVLEGVLGIASTSLEHSLTGTLNDLEQQLFKLAEQAKSNEQQNRCFESLREIRRARADVTPRFLIRLEAALASIKSSQKAPSFARMNRNQREEFSLVDPQEFEESLALQEVASKAEIRLSQPLFALGQRFGVLAGSAAVEPDELPIGPHRLCECLRHAARCLDVQLEHRVLLYRAFDRVCMTQLGALYDQINDLCIENRILPNLQFSHTRARRNESAPVAPAQTERPAPESGGPATPAGAPASNHAAGGHAGAGAGGHAAGGAQTGAGHAGGHAGAGHAGGHGGSTQPGGSYGGDGGGAGHSVAGGAARTSGGLGGPRSGSSAQGNTGASPSPAGGSARPNAGSAAGGTRGGASSGQSGGYGPAPAAGANADTGARSSTGKSAPAAPDLTDVPGMGGFANPMTGWPGTAPAQPDHGMQADARDLELFDTMRDLLAGRRHALGGPSQTTPENAHQVRTEDVQSVLSALQNKPTPPMMIGGKMVTRSVGHLKQDMLTQLRQLTPEGRQPKLNELDADTVDLVGMLFDHLGKDVKPDSAVQQLMTRLQIPLLRVALKDKSFFTRRSHPARQLLNAVAEAGLFWLDDESDDRALVEKMRLVVDRVSAEYDDKVEVFEDLLGDLSKHLGTVARKSEVAERRHVDAAKGRERLELARATASKAISERIGKKKPPPLIKTLLEQAWTDVLALTLLRQGEGSEIYNRRLGIADQLLDAVTSEGNREHSRGSDASDKILKQEVESGLAQVGYHIEDVQAVTTRLFGGPAAAANDDPASLTELAIKLKSRSRLGSDTEAEKDSRPTAKAGRAPALVLTPEEQRVLERLRTVPFGTWFEFSINQQGDKARRKLSWFSTVTGRCLFVNQRGVKSEEKTMEGLAREIVRGLAHVVEAQKESLIDRAWSAIMSTLKQFSGKAPAMAVKPA